MFKSNDQEKLKKTQHTQTHINTQTLNSQL